MTAEAGSSRIARDSFNSLVLRLVELVTAGGILVLTARGLGPDGRGLYALVLVGTMFAQVPLFGVAAPLSSALAHGRRSAAVLRGASVTIVAVAGGLISLALLVTAVLWPSDVLLYAAIAAPPMLLLNYQQTLTITTGRVVLYGLLFIVPQLISFAALATGMVIAPGDDKFAVACWAGAQWIVPLGGLVLERPELRLRGEREFFLALLRRGAPVSLATGISRINNRVTMIVVAALLPLGDVGRYSVAVSGVEALLMLSMATTTGAYRAVVAAPEHEAVRVTVQVFRHSFLLVALAGLVGTLAAVVLVRPVFGAEYTGVWEAFALLVPGTIAFGASSVLRTFFTVRLERSREFLATSVLSVIGSVAVSVALVPVIGIAGAAIGTSAGYTASAVYLVVRFRRFGGEPRLRAYLPAPADLGRYVAFVSGLGRRVSRSGTGSA